VRLAEGPLRLVLAVIPAGYQELMSDPDQGRRDRAMRAVFGMKKLDMAAIQAAADEG